MKNKLLQGTMVLLCSSVVLRCLGFVYQILVVRIAGTESLGILNMTMPFYMLLVVVATMGMPIAITKLTAQYAASHGQAVIAQMMRTAFGLVLILSVVCLIAACVVMPEVFALLNTEQRVQQCFLVLIPGIVIVPFCSVMRGYFQGMQQMVYPSIGQIIEQLIRVFCGIGLILWLSPKDVLSLAMSLGCAAMLGEAGGCA
ncbi:MAG: oligosaccharide flippase family protein, partial [Peptococcaceae bacterium]|nr:oligosaccharide flippase family protein [Peptococcaceae bacterium]